MKILTLLLIPLLGLIMSCTINGNDEKEIESVNGKTVKIEKKCELNNNWEGNSTCYESVTSCDKDNFCVTPLAIISCGEDFSEGQTKC